MKSYKKEMMNTQCKNTNEKKTLSTNSNGHGSSRASNGKVMAVEADTICRNNRLLFCCCSSYFCNDINLCWFYDIMYCRFYLYSVDVPFVVIPIDWIASFVLAWRINSGSFLFNVGSPPVKRSFVIPNVENIEIARFCSSKLISFSLLVRSMPSRGIQ